MRNKNIGTWVATLLITMLTFMGLGQTMVHAVDGNGNGTTPVPTEQMTEVIITKVETSDKAKDMTLEQLGEGVDVATYFTDGKGIPGVTFTYYSVTDAQLTTMTANPASFDTVAEVDAVVGVGSGTLTAQTDATGQVTLSGLPEGNYWVVENTEGTVATSTAVPFGLILPFTNVAGTGYLETIYVYPKNTLKDDDPEIKKEVDESNVAIGELNTWTISLDIPDGIEDYDKFEFYDDIDTRLDFEGLGSVDVLADGITLTDGTDYDISFIGRRLEVKFTAVGLDNLEGITSNPQEVKVTFQTRVNNTAIMGQEIPNSATLTFDNGTGNTGTKVPGEIPSVHTGGKAFVKRDGASNATLNGAEFKVRGPNNQFVKVGINDVITFGSEADATVFTSANGGKFEVKGLPYGTYQLVEIKAPQGYALPTNPETAFVVDAVSFYTNPAVVGSGSNLSNNEQFVNNRRLVIPQTGGIGTAVFTVIGAVMMLFSALFYKRTKKV